MIGGRYPRFAAARKKSPRMNASQTTASADLQPRARASQCAPAVLMVRPARFGYNLETAASNHFQRRSPQPGPAAEQAVREFSALQTALASRGVHTCVIDDTPEPVKPDAVFPNNWVSFHDDGTVVLYPMQARNRRAERRLEALAAVERELSFRCRHLLDLSSDEQQGRYLEGTGSLVLDRTQGVAYACRSPRTDEGLVREWARAMRYEAEIFDARGPAGAPIYHTNVMLAIGARSAVVCLAAVAPDDRARVRARLADSGRTIIEISPEAMQDFAANVLELRATAVNAEPRSLLVMSARARAAFDAGQLAALSAAVDELVDIAIPTIETLGGGGVRCMLAEVPASAGLA